MQEQYDFENKKDGGRYHGNSNNIEKFKMFKVNEI